MQLAVESIEFLITMEAEPTFASAPSSTFVTPKLQAQIGDAVAALPLAHRRPPTKGEIVESPNSGYARLQDWSFIYRFCLAIELGNAERTFAVFIT